MAATHPFKCSLLITFQEARSGRVIFPEQQPHIMARVILFMYTGDYSDEFLPEFYVTMAGDERGFTKDFQPGFSREIDELRLRHPLKVNALLYGCADMLGLDVLKTIASE